ncbi:hypothetical protein TIFTF001_003172 [Ficus carica]|uniref:Uncharacterized protein n=1 Tax=Ficus carica TaxID=3494 RepID=A0AA87Z6W2_FICCA|nr:hypothetical protein TIFTF001_003172 [Ficus carica]
MNSMFSCFDAFCAELLFSNTSLRFSSSSSSFSSSQPNRAFIASDKATTDNVNGNGNGELSPEKKIKNRQIRSAPEFDGLHCFETIVRY